MEHKSWNQAMIDSDQAVSDWLQGKLAEVVEELKMAEDSYNPEPVPEDAEAGTNPFLPGSINHRRWAEGIRKFSETNDPGPVPPSQPGSPLYRLAYGDETPQDKARRYVYEYIKYRQDWVDTHVTFGFDEVNVVWFCKTLQNWKCLIVTTLPGRRYYEVTHDGDEQKTYVDVYEKSNNIVISEGEHVSDMGGSPE